MLRFLNDNSVAVQALAGAAQAFFALILIFVGILQVCIYYKLRRDGIIRDRAFVFPQTFGAIPGVNVATRHTATFWAFEPVWENTGGTRTIEMINHVNFIEFGSEIPDEFEFPDFYGGDWFGYAKLLLGPRQTLRGQPLERPVDTLLAVKRRERRLFLYGWAEYYDVFDSLRLHRTEFCREIMVLGEPNEINCQFRFDITGKFNGADADCYRKAGHRAPLINTPYTAHIGAPAPQEPARGGTPSQAQQQQPSKRAQRRERGRSNAR